MIAHAAERRTESTDGCASGTQTGNILAEEASRNGFRTKAEEDDANQRAIQQAYIELMEEEEKEMYGSSYIPPSQQNPTGYRGNSSTTAISRNSTTRPPPSFPQPNTPATGVHVFDNIPDENQNDAAYNNPWSCPICTLDNPPNFLCCGACGTERPTPTTTTTNENQSINAGNDLARERQRKYEQEQRIRKRARPSGNNTQTTSTRTRALQSLAVLDREVQKRPIGWVCHRCGAFMEIEFWTCSSCGQFAPEGAK